MAATHMVANKILLTITDGSSNWSRIKDQFRQEMGQHKYLLKALEVPIQTAVADAIGPLRVATDVINTRRCIFLWATKIQNMVSAGTP